MNERNTLKYVDGILNIGGVNADELAKKYSTPLYVYDQKHIEDMCQTFKMALENYYGNGMISYASKAFCCKEIYRLIKKYSIGADVVSEGELYTALSVNFPAENIIFHGNNKSYNELLFSVKSKVKYIVIDSYLEADMLDEICKELKTYQSVMIRINPGVEAHTHKFIQTARTDSKFGFSIDNGDAIDIVKYVRSKSNLNLVGLHCHIGSQIFENKSFLMAIEKMMQFYSVCKKELNMQFSVLDLGGGFGIYYSGNDPKLRLSDYDECVKSISEKVIACVEKFNLSKPYLILEPGRAIVGEAGVTLYTIGSIKSIKDVKDYISIDGGMFENPRYALYQAKYLIKPVVDKVNYNFTYSVAGKCCESGDLIAEDISLPNMKNGDLLAVFSTGAYNYSMASNYNRNFIPAVVMVKDGISRVVVKRQNHDDLIKNDI